MPLSETVLLLMALLGIGVLISGLFSKLPVPYTVLLVVVGMLLGNLAEVVPALAPIQHFHLSPELVFFVFLPALLFESGLSLNARQLAKDIIPVLMLAVPALLVSTTLVGLGVWWLMPIDLIAALLFGALISATDPVAVVSLFKELGTPLRLMVLVEGESLLNDATAIVVFTILLGLATHGGFVFTDIGAAALKFVEVFFGGALVGVVFGLLITWLTIRLHLSVSSVLVCSIILAYVAFIVAEHQLHFSGVMAVVAAAVVFGMFAMPRLPQNTGHALHETWEFLADTTNTLLFLMIGMTVDLPNLLRISGFVVLVALLVIAARACTVYTFVPATVAWFKLPKVTLGERHIMWWGGLKGGLAIAIALSIPADFAGRALLLDLTLGVVMLSLLINAPTIRPLIQKLGLDKLSEDEQIELKQTTSLVKQRTDEVLRKFLDHRVISKAGHYQAEREVEECLEWPSVEISPNSMVRKQLLDVIREEGKELDRLFSAGVIPQYSFLDVKAELQARRDQVSNAQRLGEASTDAGPTRFERFEAALVRRLREYDWATGLLAAYQNTRISQHIIKHIVHILMAEAALEYIEAQNTATAPVDDAIRQQYQHRLRQLHDEIADYQRDFGQLYERFETRFAKKAALASVLQDVENELKKGSIGTKVYVVLEHSINRALDEIPDVSESVAELSNEQLIGLVPMFKGFPDNALVHIAERASRVDFLPGDVVIGEGEHGDAVYVVAKGRLRASVKDKDQQRILGDLFAGDCFGEMALLGENVRRASVECLYACTLLRLSATEVRALSEQFPEITTYLNELNRQREVELESQR